MFVRFCFRLRQEVLEMAGAQMIVEMNNENISSFLIDWTYILETRALRNQQSAQVDLNFKALLLTTDFIFCFLKVRVQKYKPFRSLGKRQDYDYSCLREPR